MFYGLYGRVKPNDDPELYQYYYHADNLGSASYLTNLDGEIAQHIEYVPFGEVFLEERNNKWNSPYLFNGKELDEETGLVYYGARYYNPRESVWLSVDPIALYDPVMQTEHYIDGEHNNGYFNPKNTSIYGYCYQNPILYVDPNGKQVYFTKFQKSSYEGRGWFGKGVNFMVNTLKGTANGAIDLWNYAGDLTNPEDIWDMDYGNEKLSNDAIKTFDNIKQYAQNTTLKEFGKDLKGVLTDVNTYEDLVGALLTTKGLGSLSKAGKAAKLGKVGKVSSKVDDAAKNMSDWLGEGFKVKTNKAGDNIFMSKDGNKKIRFDIKNSHRDKPHIHIEMKNANGKWKDALKGTHRIYPKD